MPNFSKPESAPTPIPERVIRLIPIRIVKQVFFRMDLSLLTFNAYQRDSRLIRNTKLSPMILFAKKQTRQNVYAVSWL